MKSHQRTLAALLLGVCTSFSATVAFAASADMGSVDSGFFKSVDLNNDGNISREELLHYTDQVFLSMDGNSDDTLTSEEFLEWDPGYLHLAEQMKKTEQLTAAKQAIYKTRDLNTDGTLEHDEFSTSTLYDFYKADTDKNRTLNQAEFLGEYSILKAVRAVFK